jgi:arylsulfatase A-like enzyme
VPKADFDLMNFMQAPNEKHQGGDFARQVYLARVRYIDEAIGRLVILLKSKSMYANTLIVFTAGTKHRTLDIRVVTTAP